MCPGVCTASMVQPAPSTTVAVAKPDVGVERGVDGLLGHHVVGGVDGAMRTEGERGGAGLVRQPAGQRGVIGVAVGHQDVGDPLALERGGEGGLMRLELRAGIDDRDLAARR